MCGEEVLGRGVWGTVLGRGVCRDGPWMGACGKAVLIRVCVGRRSLEGCVSGGGSWMGACGEEVLGWGRVGRRSLDGGVWEGGP